MATTNMANMGKGCDTEKPPSEAIFLRMTAAMSKKSRKLKLYYDKAAKVAVKGGDIAAALRQVQQGEVKWCRPQVYEPCYSPLSIRNMGNQYIVIVLDERVNWQFARDCVPFTIQKDATKIYVDARRAYVDARSGEIVLVDGKTVRDGCSIALFTAYGKSRAKGDDYVPFNMFVELLYGKKGKIPIIIDPMIGIPGGNGP